MLDTLFAAKHNGNQIDDEGIQEEVDTFIFTGYDTVSAAIIHSLAALANHSDVQQKVYEEIQELMSNYKFIVNIAASTMCFLKRTHDGFFLASLSLPY